MSKFKNDLDLGKSGEQFLATLLENVGFTVEKCNNADYDLRATIHGSSVTFEIKYDRMSGKTGNIAIEFYNPLSQKNSGITITKADYWVQILPDKSIYITKTTLLKEYIKNNLPQRIISRGGDSNASLYLYKASVILPALFIRINENPELLLGLRP